jgi:hypothetical protein
MKVSRALLFCLALPAAGSWATTACAYTDFGKGKPITAVDLSGKKFCWSNGRWVIYDANGQFTNLKGTHKQWSVPEPGVLYINNHYVQIEVLSDGRLHSYRYCLLCGDHDLDTWATPCN